MCSAATKNVAIVKPAKLQAAFSRLVVSASGHGSTLFSIETEKQTHHTRLSPISARISSVDGRLAADDNEGIRVASSDNAEPLMLRAYPRYERGNKP